MTIFLSSDYHCDDYFQTSKEFCVDVSTYEPVEWVEEEAETCETVFVKVILDPHPHDDHTHEDQPHVI